MFTFLQCISFHFRLKKQPLLQFTAAINGYHGGSLTALKCWKVTTLLFTIYFTYLGNWVLKLGIKGGINFIFETHFWEIFLIIMFLHGALFFATPYLQHIVHFPHPVWSAKTQTSLQLNATWLIKGMMICLSSINYRALWAIYVGIFTSVYIQHTITLSTTQNSS